MGLNLVQTKVYVLVLHNYNLLNLRNVYVEQVKLRDKFNFWRINKIILGRYMVLWQSQKPFEWNCSTSCWYVMKKLYKCKSWLNNIFWVFYILFAVCCHSVSFIIKAYWFSNFFSLSDDTRASQELLNLFSNLQKTCSFSLLSNKNWYKVFNKI